jgi:hypothetical protein
MHSHFACVPLLAIAGLFLACSSGSPAASTGSATSFSCASTLAGVSTCILYEATGTDAALVIEQVRAGCVSQGGATLEVVASCPSAGNLGGCRTPVTVTGGSAELTATSYSYTCSSILCPTSEAEVQSQCSEQGSGATFVAP